jgi:hypothetical protein
LAKNKSHHDVPRFYLRRFSTDDRKRTINVFNLERATLFQNASIKHQSCEDYLYSKDPAFENILASHENDIAPITNDIIVHDQLPPRNSPDYISLVYFVLLQRFRTAKAADDVKHVFNSIIRNFASNDPTLPPHVDEITLDIPAPALQSIATMSSVFVVASDLECVLLKNQSGEQFLSSDNPVFSENRYMEIKEAYGCQTGIACKGLRMFFPLSPDHLLLLFDPTTYKASHAKGGAIYVNNKWDIWLMNRLQFVGAQTNIYCSNSFCEDHLQNYLARSLKLRSEAGRVAIEHKSPDKSRRSLLEVGHCDPACGLILSFMQITKQAMNTPLRASVAQPRNLDLCRAIHEFGDLVDTGLYDVDQLHNYLKDSSFGSQNR